MWYLIASLIIVILLLVYIAWRVAPNRDLFSTLTQQDAIDTIDSALERWKEENPNHPALQQQKSDQ